MYTRRELHLSSQDNTLRHVEKPFYVLAWNKEEGDRCACVYTHNMYIYVYIYISLERERERERKNSGTAVMRQHGVALKKDLRVG